MKLGGLFGPKPRTLASAKTTTKKLADMQPTKKKKGFKVKWPPIPQQQVKDYKVIYTIEELRDYLKRCEETGICGFDYETAPSKEYRKYYESLSEEEQQELENDFLRSPLDPWKADVCTLSLSAAPHEARIIPISHKVGDNFGAIYGEHVREVVMDVLDAHLFRNEKIIKIAVNLIFETKFTAKYGKYILSPVADPLMMWVRCLQILAPQKLEDAKKPNKGWGLKPATKKVLGVEMKDFSKLLKEKNVSFFDEIAASTDEGMVYSAEDADYAVQHYLYWREVAKQIPDYDKWLHETEMPFQRALGLMEYWGMKWDENLATMKQEEAETMQQQAIEGIKKIAKDTFDLDINPGKSGKTGEVKHLIFEVMKLPAAKWGKTGASLDKEALLDMTFMLENKLHSIDEEKYLAVKLPEDWQAIDPDTDPNLDKAQRGAIRIAQREEHSYKKEGLQLITYMQQIQSYSTLLSSHIVGRAKYLNPMSGRIHAGYSTFTDTARCNSFRPNGQNTPRTDNDVFKIRNFYVPEPGKILFFIDFSGFELRLMAWKSGDETMIDAFNHGGDLHRKTAATMTGKQESEITKEERTNAKAGNFGIAYGGTEHALQKTFKVDYGLRKTLDECAKIVQAVKNTYKRIPEFQREMTLQARENGYVKTIYGYIRMLDINSTDRRVRSSAERQAANTPIQGSAADIMKRCQNEVYEAIGRGIGPMGHGKTDMIAQIHDEIVFEIEDDPVVVQEVEKFVKSIMEQPPAEDFPVPILAEGSVGYRWGEKMDVSEYLEKRGVKPSV